MCLCVRIKYHTNKIWIINRWMNWRWFQIGYYNLLYILHSFQDMLKWQETRTCCRDYILFIMWSEKVSRSSRISWRTTLKAGTAGWMTVLSEYQQLRLEPCWQRDSGDAEVSQSPSEWIILKFGSDRHPRGRNPNDFGDPLMSLALTRRNWHFLWCWVIAS